MPHTITITHREKVDARFLKVEAGVRYWEDADVNGVDDNEGTLIPCREGNFWKPTIDLDAGKIENWPAGTIANVHYKVCDAGVYALLDSERNVVKTIDGYVPNILWPAEPGYGDYINMSIGANGEIMDWRVDLSDFEDGDDE